MGVAVRQLRESEILLQALLFAANENRVTISDSLERILSNLINFGEETEALLALEITSRLGWPLRNIGGVKHQEVFTSWERVADRIFENCSNRITILSCKHCSVCGEALWRGKAPVSDLIKWHGFQGLFQQTNFNLFPEEHFAAFAFELTFELGIALLNPSEERPRKFVKWIETLKEIGHVSLEHPLPWIRGPLDTEALRNLSYFLPEMATAESQTSMKSEELGSEWWFGLFVLLAIPLEYLHDENAINRIKRSSHPFFNSFRWILIARFEADALSKLQEVMNTYGFTVEQQAFIWKWSRGEIDLLQSEFLQNQNSSSEEDGRDKMFGKSIDL